MKCLRVFALAAVTLSVVDARDKRETPTLDDYVHEAAARGRGTDTAAGSLFDVAGPLGNMAADVRATQVDDLVTIVVSDKASAISRGAVSSSRAAKAQSGIAALGGITRAAGPLANLASLGGEHDLSGEGSTTRENVITTTLSARITHVLPNGVMLVAGTKNISINSEMHTVRIRGLIRRPDVTSGNLVRSDRIADMEITVDGRGVVGDAIRRPFILYRLLTGILPF
jgi:flagellar L-ring protein precursor FlgH